MSCFRLSRLAAFAGCMALAACATPVKKAETLEASKLAFASLPVEQRVAGAESFLAPGPRSPLAGRTIVVHQISDIQLQPKEVVLTFDDGPVPGRTERILDALEARGVKATFLMVGQMAQAHPDIAKKVAIAGHTIGTHTQDHANLAHLSLSRAMGEIEEGKHSVAAALQPTRYKAAPFFRFPYLADSSALRNRLAAEETVVIDVDIDSKDYFQSAPEQIRRRTMEALAHRGSGIILMHDLHARTAGMLPGLLQDLQAQGYKVVHLVPGNRSISEGGLVASILPEQDVGADETMLGYPIAKTSVFLLGASALSVGAF
ncbi:polysaccharide deacetylase family protein [Corticibacterium sp. UT-5YL-CI-8]|nr:polysaccharide deacetylase family protein [Tianweitania sp. UT-5YL-CI-8]